MSTRSSIAIVESAFSEHNITIPKRFAAALAERDELESAAAAMRAPSSTDIGDALVAAMMAGRDPLEDPEVLRLGVLLALAGETGSNIEHRIAQAAERRTLIAVTECADDIIAAMKICADEHGEKLAAAHRILGGVELTNSGAVLQLGVDAAAAWIAAKNSSKAITLIGKAWVTLATMTGLASATTPSALRMADAPLDVFEKLQHKCSPWEIVVAGGTVDLADFHTAAERVQRIYDERTARDAAAPTFSDSYRKTRGNAVVLS